MHVRGSYEVLTKRALVTELDNEMQNFLSPFFYSVFNMGIVRLKISATHARGCLRCPTEEDTIVSKTRKQVTENFPTNILLKHVRNQDNKQEHESKLCNVLLQRTCQHHLKTSVVSNRIFLKQRVS
jgi:hypothetical protein